MPMRYGWWGTSKERRERERKRGKTVSEDMMNLCIQCMHTLCVWPPVCLVAYCILIWSNMVFPHPPSPPRLSLRYPSERKDEVVFVVKGAIQAVQEDCLRATLFQLKGSSGSPAVDERGTVIGVLSRAHADMSCYISKVSDIRLRYRNNCCTAGRRGGGGGGGENV